MILLLTALVGAHIYTRAQQICYFDTIWGKSLVYTFYIICMQVSNMLFSNHVKRCAQWNVMHGRCVRPVCPWVIGLFVIAIQCLLMRGWSGINPRWGISCSSQCYSTGVIKIVVWAISHMVDIKDLLLLLGKSNPSSGSSKFLLSLYKWSFNICATQYNSK